MGSSLRQEYIASPFWIKKLSQYSEAIQFFKCCPFKIPLSSYVFAFFSKLCLQFLLILINWPFRWKSFSLKATLEPSKLHRPSVQHTDIRRRHQLWLWKKDRSGTFPMFGTELFFSSPRKKIVILNNIWGAHPHFAASWVVSKCICAQFKPLFKSWIRS